MQHSEKRRIVAAFEDNHPLPTITPTQLLSMKMEYYGLPEGYTNLFYAIMEQSISIADMIHMAKDVFVKTTLGGIVSPHFIEEKELGLRENACDHFGPTRILVDFRTLHKYGTIHAVIGLLSMLEKERWIQSDEEAFQLFPGYPMDMKMTFGADADVVQDSPYFPALMQALVFSRLTVYRLIEHMSLKNECVASLLEGREGGRS
jgi:hypothetical protein